MNILIRYGIIEQSRARPKKKHRIHIRITRETLYGFSQKLHNITTRICKRFHLNFTSENPTTMLKFEIAYAHVLTRTVGDRVVQNDPRPHHQHLFSINSRLNHRRFVHLIFIILYYRKV